MLQYSKKVIEHFRNPRNQGVIKDADAVGQEGNAACGDVMKMYLKIKDDHIKDVKFETLGCAASIAVSSALTEMIKGKTLEEAMNVSKDDVARDLGGLPPIKMHCSMLGVDTLHTAIKNYKK
ncbi:MAG: iron-sulfur cluster assembly scaffold protein [Patescibacteria group bacterium]